MSEVPGVALSHRKTFTGDGQCLSHPEIIALSIHLPILPERTPGL